MRRSSFRLVRPVLRTPRAGWTTVLVLAFILAQSGSAGRAGAGLASTICHGADRPWLLESAALTAAAHAAPAPDAPELRVVTYNIHSGLGEHHALRRPRAEVEHNLRAIAADIADSTGGDGAVDVVALNEVDFDSRRSAGIDEAAFLAEDLGRRTGAHYDVVRGETWRRNFPGLQVRFGNALLIRLPIVASSACLLSDDRPCESAPPLAGLPSLRRSGIGGFLQEQRGVIKVTVRSGLRLVDVLVTHLEPFAATARETQALHILRRFVDPSRTTVLLGDLNAVPTVLTGGRRFFGQDRTLDILTSDSLADVRMSYASEHALASLDHWATYPAAAPRWPLDAVLASVDLEPRTIRVVGNVASDHRGLFARLALVDGDADLARQHARHELIRNRQLARIRECDIATDDARRSRGWLVQATGFKTLAKGVVDNHSGPSR